MKFEKYSIIKVNEIFYSLQGEGPKTGVPSIFIRLPFCPLRCKWCDSKSSSWEPTFEMIMFQELKNFIDKHKPCDEIVITGGEPMIWDRLQDLLDEFPSHNFTIETSGIKYQDLKHSYLTYSISPKTRNSIPLEKKEREQHLKNLKFDEAFLKNTDFNTYYKFVIMSPADLLDVDDFVLKNCIDTDQIYLMPEGATREEQEKSKRMVADTALKYGYNYCQRLHVDIWGGKRGT